MYGRKQKCLSFASKATYNLILATVVAVAHFHVASVFLYNLKIKNRKETERESIVFHNSRCRQFLGISRISMRIITVPRIHMDTFAQKKINTRIGDRCYYNGRRIYSLLTFRRNVCENKSIKFITRDISSRESFIE